MKYYKVKAEYDNKTRYRNSGGIRAVDGFLIGGELYTPKEFERLLNNPACFEMVEIPKSKIYFFFGARFA